MAENAGTLARTSVDVGVNMAPYDRAMGQIQSQLQALSSRLVRISVAVGFAGGVKNLIDTATDLETRLVALRKASDQTDQGFATLKARMYALSTTIKGVSLENLIGIATTGAKLGIAADDLVTYAEGIAKVSSAMDDIPVTQIADEIGKLNVIFKLGIPGTQQLGSAIDKVADSGVSSASGILNVTQRISGAAVAARLTAQESIALSAALLDTGTHAELASSAILHLIQKLSNVKAQAGFARVIGVSAEEFAKQVKEKPLEAITAFLAAVKKLDAGSQNAAFHAIGIKGDQGTSELQKLAQQVDNIKKYAGLANNEFKTLNQLNQSYALTAGTTAAATENFKNKITILKDRIGSDLTPAFGAAMGILGNWATAVTDAMATVETGLAAVWGRLKTFPEALSQAVGPEATAWVTEFGRLFGEYLVQEVEMVARVFRNLPDYLDIAVLKMTEGVINIGEHLDTLMQNFGIFGGYIAKNWTGMLLDAFNAIGLSIINLGKNLANLGSSFVTFLQDPTQGFQFDWTPLLEGFQAETAKLPEFIAPALTSLQDAIDEKFAAIGDKEAARAAAMAAAVTGAAKPVPDAAALAGAGEGHMEEAGKKKGVQMGTLDDLYKSLQAGVLSKKDPVQEGILANGKAQIGILGQIRDAAVKPKNAVAVAAGPA